MTSTETSLSLGETLDALVSQMARRPHSTFRDLAGAAKLDPSRDFVGTSLTHIDLREQDLRGFNFDKADLTGADFRRANVDGVSFEGAVLTGVIGLPPEIHETVFEFPTVVNVGELIKGATLSRTEIGPSNVIIFQYNRSLSDLLSLFFESIKRVGGRVAGFAINNHSDNIVGVNVDILEGTTTPLSAIRWLFTSAKTPAPTPLFNLRLSSGIVDFVEAYHLELNEIGLKIAFTPSDRITPRGAGYIFLTIVDHSAGTQNQLSFLEIPVRFK